MKTAIKKGGENNNMKYPNWNHLRWQFIEAAGLKKRRVCQKTVKYLIIKIRKTPSDVSSLYQLEFPKKCS